MIHSATLYEKCDLCGSYVPAFSNLCGRGVLPEVRNIEQDGKVVERKIDFKDKSVCVTCAFLISNFVASMNGGA